MSSLNNTLIMYTDSHISAYNITRLYELLHGFHGEIQTTPIWKHGSWNYPTWFKPPWYEQGTTVSDNGRTSDVS